MGKHTPINFTHSLLLNSMDLLGQQNKAIQKKKKNKTLARCVALSISLTNRFTLFIYDRWGKSLRL